MKRLFICRHAKTEPYTTSSTDYDRSLTDRGHKDIILVGNYLMKTQPLVQGIYHSSAMRTTETAEDFRDLYLAEKDAQVGLNSEKNLYAASTSQVMDLIYTFPDELDSVMVVGHNPSIASFLYHFGLEEVVPTTGTGVLSIETNKWVDWSSSTVNLLDFVTPKQFK